MFALIALRRAMALLCLAVLPIAAFAQSADKPFTPMVGMPGKDVGWLPADLVIVNKMMELAKVGPGDVVVDLGSGDGRMVIGAARHGARAIGVELNADLAQWSRSIAEKEGLSDRTRFITRDLFDFDLNQANVITLFLTPGINMRLRPALVNLKPGTRIVGNTFTMGDWEHDGIMRDEYKPANCHFFCVAYLWIVPAKVAGTWQLRNGQLKLEQRFQMVTGTLSAGGASVAVEGRIRGDQITLTAPAVEFTGRIAGTDMGGTVKINGIPTGWHAVLIGN